MIGWNWMGRVVESSFFIDMCHPVLADNRLTIVGQHRSGKMCHGTRTSLHKLAAVLAKISKHQSSV